MSNIYEDVVTLHVKSVMSGESEEQRSLVDLKTSSIGLEREFATDDDIQYMKVISTNLGMIRAYQKNYKRENSNLDGVGR